MSEGAIEQAVRLQCLGRRFGRRVALRDVSFDVEPGECIGLVGPNGAGKSTLLSIVSGMSRPSAGSVTVFGDRPGSRALLGKIGIMPEGSPFAPAARVGEYFEFLARIGGVSHPKRAAERALASVGGADWARLEFGSLSYGMRRLACLAQAFLGDPRLVLLDEPTEGLDGRALDTALRTIGAAQGESTVLVASHDFAAIERLCERVVVLDAGRVVAVEPTSIDSSSCGELELECDTVLPALELLRALPGVLDARFEEQTHRLILKMDSTRTNAESLIESTARALGARGVSISAIERGQKLERRVARLLSNAPDGARAA